jgi:hypothetical protein
MDLRDGDKIASIAKIAREDDAAVADAETPPPEQSPAPPADSSAE